jgi:hypothetical protein
MSEDANWKRHDCGSRTNCPRFSARVAHINLNGARSPGNSSNNGRQEHLSARSDTRFVEVFEHWPVAPNRPRTRGIDTRSQFVCNRSRARNRGISSFESLDERARRFRHLTCCLVLLETPQELLGALVLGERVGCLQSARG